MIRDERTPPRVTRLLTQITDIKKYGEEQGLKPTSNYQDYVKLDRPAAIWVVSACEPLRFEAKEWGFPIVGSFPYLGWFDLKDAQSYAEDLRKDGLDVDVRGAAAYSTLGWFRDAVLSTMISEGDDAMGELVDVVLHESVHATYYVKNQSYLNESVARFAGEKLAESYLEKRFGKDSIEVKAYRDGLKQGERRERELHEAYVKLEKLYASSKSDAEKLEEKAKILAKLKTDLGFQREINNATLIQFKTYGASLEEFGAVFRACGSQWSRFWGAMRTLKPESFSEPQQENLSPVLLGLARAGCPQASE